jgi:2-polyprenyl-6-methoxyphenol hydroxylase-like FAD-dependent oxidoreductase
MTAPEIAIIGGGPCGLTLAHLLECKGIDYNVYERDKNEHVRGMAGSLDIRAESGQHAIWEAGLTEQFMKHARYEDTRFALADKFGKMHLEVAQIRNALEIGCTELRYVLLESIPKEKVKWGHSLAEATFDENKRPVLRFSNGTVLSGCKLVVGTDGAWSKVRPLV